MMRDVKIEHGKEAVNSMRKNSCTERDKIPLI